MAMLTYRQKLSLAKLRDCLDELSLSNTPLAGRYKKSCKIFWGGVLGLVGMGVGSWFVFPFALTVIVPTLMLWGFFAEPSGINPKTISAHQELTAVEMIREIVSSSPNMRGWFGPILNQLEQKMLTNTDLSKLNSCLEDVRGIKDLSEDDIPTVLKSIESVRKLLTTQEIVLERPQTHRTEIQVKKVFRS